MGNKEEKWTQCVTLAVLLMMVMTVEGTDPVCRPFCHLPPETHEKCSSLRFLFSCISKVKMRYNSEKVSLNYIYFIKVGFKKKKKIKTKLNCGNAVTNVKHLTHVNYIPQICLKNCTCVSFCSFTRCTMNLHCSCEWLHALENVYLESERLAKVRNSNIFEQCTGTLTEDCGEFIRHLNTILQLVYNL